MLDLSAAILNHLQTRAARDAHLLVWIAARNRETDASETIGFWTGADHRDFSIGGETRSYYGAGTLLKMDSLVVETGLQVRTHRLVFSSVAPEVQLATRGYETREAPFQMHVAYSDALTKELIDAPVRRFKGVCAGLKITRPKKGGEANLELSVQSAAKQLTKTLPLKKSDAALRARAPADALRKATDVGGLVESAWGTYRSKGPEGASEGNKSIAPALENTDR